MGRLIDKWGANAKRLAKRALDDERLLAELLQGILSKKDETRYTRFKALMFVSEERPELLYPHWDYFVQLIDSDSAHSKYIASYLIASLTAVDTDCKFEKIFEKYYSMLDDRSVIPAAHVARNSGKIAKAKPALEAKITEKLLSIDKTHHKPDRRELVKSEAIVAFSEYFDRAQDKERILEFVNGQLKSKSPKNRKNAREFLKKWAKS